MKTTVWMILLGLSLANDAGWTQPDQPMLFSLRPQTLAFSNCVASPGNVPIPLEAATTTLEIVDWSTAAADRDEAGEFLVQFQQPVPVGSLIAYEPGDISYLSGGEWRPLAAPDQAGRGLQVVPFPEGVAVEAVKLTQDLRLQRQPGTASPAYQATLPFLTLAPLRLANVAAEAIVTVSSADQPSQGFQPKPWVNQPDTLVDGYIDARQNFSTAKRDLAITADNPEWVMLSWDQAQSIRALALFHGSAEKGFGDLVIERYAGDGDPRFAHGANAWQTVESVKTTPGRFGSNEFFIFAAPIETRALRLTSTGGVPRVSLAEICALRDISVAPLSAPAKAQAGIPIPFEIPAAGKVTLQIRDEHGDVVANPVAGVEFPAGKNTAYWNLDDVEGRPVLQPGNYRWHGLWVPDLRVEYRYTYFPYPLAGVAWQTEDGKGGWLADHEPPRTIARAGTNLWLGAFAEAGDSIVETDADGNKLWGINRIWVAIPAEICTDGPWYFGWCEGGWIKDNQAIIQINMQTKESRKIFQREMPAKDVSLDDMRSHPAKRGVTGFQVAGSLAFVSFGKLDVIQVFDIATGLAGPWRGFGWDVAYKQFDDQKPALVREIRLPSPGRLRRYGAGQLVTTSGKDVVLIDLKTFAVKPLFTGKLENPLGLGVDEVGNVYVGEGAPRHQVFGYTPQGERFATLGKPGRREVGPFDVDDLEEPYGVEVGPDGRVWVMEFTEWPKRVSLWNPKTGKCVKAIYGPAQYGGGGCLDPADETRLFYKGMEFRRDPASGRVTPVNLYYRPDSACYARFSDSDYPEYAFRAEGHLWMTSFMWPHGHPSLVLWQFQKDHVMPVAALGSVIALREAFGAKPGNKRDPEDWRNTDFLTKHVPGYSPDQKFFTWTDLDADGRIQPGELKFGKLMHEGKLLTHASAGWNWRMNETFAAAANAGQGRMIFFQPRGRTERGYPLYEVPTATVAGGGEALGVDSHGNAVVLGGPMTSVGPEGRVRWRYRNDWPGLHAGHRTTARGDEPGVLIAPTRIWGIVRANDTLGDVVAFNSNLGCTYLMTCDDGLYIDRVFRDQRVGLLWRMSEPPAPDVLAETSLYDEHFGGTFQKVRGRDGRDHFYYVCGKNHCSVVELSGLENIRRLKGDALAVSAGQIAAAQERRQREAARKNEPKVYTVRRVEKGAINIDGKDDDWRGERLDGFALAWDAERLYVLFRGRDDRATFENKGADWVELFKSGDVVDVMLQTRPGLDAGRTQAGPGDIRLSFAMFEGRPVCVLYDFKVDGFNGRRVPFSSPWRTVWCDRVVALSDAEIQVQRAGGEYILEAAVPLKSIHLDPAALRQTRGDVGRVLSDQTGSAAASRVYWSNKYTAIMSDLPSEASLVPNLWGLFRFEE